MTQPKDDEDLADRTALLDAQTRLTKECFHVEPLPVQISKVGICHATSRARIEETFKIYISWKL